MAREVHPTTLFHLVPTNRVAQDALLHPDNKHFVSSSKNGPGLEVGYHVPSSPKGHVITRLGRNADLILRESTSKHPMSGVHVAFVIHPTTHLVLLSVRSKRISSVTFSVLVEPKKGNSIGGNITGEEITGDGVMLYGQKYTISIASYNFNLIWRTDSKTKAEYLKALAVQGYEASQQLVQNMRSRDRPTENDDSEAQSWHITRLNTSRGPIFQDIRQLREEIGCGAYGRVYSTIDQASGRKVAVKVVDLGSQGNIDAARAILHREIKVMQRLKHVRPL